MIGNREEKDRLRDAYYAARDALDREKDRVTRRLPTPEDHAAYAAAVHRYDAARSAWRRIRGYRA